MDTTNSAGTLDNKADIQEVDKADANDNQPVTMEAVDSVVTTDMKPVTTDTESDAGSMEYTMDDIMDNISDADDEHETTLVDNDPIPTDTEKAVPVAANDTDQSEAKTATDTTDSKTSEPMAEDGSLATPGLDKPDSPTDNSSDASKTEEQDGSLPVASDKDSDKFGGGVDNDDACALSNSGSSAENTLDKSAPQSEAAVNTKAEDVLTRDGGKDILEEDVCDQTHDASAIDTQIESNRPPKSDDDPGTVQTESPCQSTVAEVPCFDPESDHTVPTAVTCVTDDTSNNDDSNKTDDEKLNSLGDNQDNQDSSQGDYQESEQCEVNETKLCDDFEQTDGAQVKLSNDSVTADKETDNSKSEVVTDQVNECNESTCEISNSSDDIERSQVVIEDTPDGTNPEVQKAQDKDINSQTLNQNKSLDSNNAEDKLSENINIETTSNENIDSLSDIEKSEPNQNSADNKSDSLSCEVNSDKLSEIIEDKPEIVNQKVNDNLSETDKPDENISEKGHEVTEDKPHEQTALTSEETVVDSAKTDDIVSVVKSDTVDSITEPVETSVQGNSNMGKDDVKDPITISISEKNTDNSCHSQVDPLVSPNSGSVRTLREISSEAVDNIVSSPTKEKDSTFEVNKDSDSVFHEDTESSDTVKFSLDSPARKRSSERSFLSRQNSALDKLDSVLDSMESETLSEEGEDTQQLEKEPRSPEQEAEILARQASAIFKLDNVLATVDFTESIDSNEAETSDKSQKIHSNDSVENPPESSPVIIEVISDKNKAPSFSIGGQSQSSEDETTITTAQSDSQKLEKYDSNVNLPDDSKPQSLAPEPPTSQQLCEDVTTSSQIETAVTKDMDTSDINEKDEQFGDGTHGQTMTSTPIKQTDKSDATTDPQDDSLKDVSFVGGEADIYAMEVDTMLEVPTMNGNATFTRPKKASKKQTSADKSHEDEDVPVGDASVHDSSFSGILDEDVRGADEGQIEKSVEPADKEKSQSETSSPSSEEPSNLAQSSDADSKSTVSDTPSINIDSESDAINSNSETVKSDVDKIEKQDTNSEAVIKDQNVVQQSDHSEETKTNDVINNNTDNQDNKSRIESEIKSEDIQNANKATTESVPQTCDNVNEQTNNVPVHGTSLCTISEDASDENSTLGADDSQNAAKGGVVMRKKDRNARQSKLSPSIVDSASRQTVATQDELLQQKIDFEIKMRDGTAKLLAASKHPSQLLEAAKSLLTSNTRMINYMQELQKCKAEQAFHKHGSDNSGSEVCKAKVCASDLRIPLMWKDTDYFKNKGDHRRFAVFCMVRQGTEIYDTSLVKEVDSSMTDIVFDDVITFNDVKPDFEVTLEVYSHKMSDDDHHIASTPRKIKKHINKLSTSVGRRLSGLKDDHDNMSHMIVGPKFEKLAEATLSLNDVSDAVCTYDFTTRDTNSDTRQSDTHHTELPLFGNICCKLAAQPLCMSVELLSSQLSVRKHKETESAGHWAVLKDQLLSLYASPAQHHTHKPATLTIPVNKTTSVQETIKDGVSMVEISNKTERVRTKYHVRANDAEVTQRWFTTLQRHINNMEAWQHACDMTVDLSSSPPQRASSFIQAPRKATQSLYESLEVDSPMTRILNRLNIEPEVEDDMDTCESRDDKENTGAPSNGQRTNNGKNGGSRSRLQTSV